MWIDKTDYQWVKVEAQAIDNISFGLFLVRLNAGSRLLFEQTKVNNDIWLPRRLYLNGSGRIALLKRVARDDEITWTNYKKFQVESKIVATQP
jgi:hypothetical protein